MEGKPFTFNILYPQIPDSGNEVVKPQQDELISICFLKYEVVNIDDSFVKYETEPSALIEGRKNRLCGFTVRRRDVYGQPCRSV